MHKRFPHTSKIFTAVSLKETYRCNPTETRANRQDRSKDTNSFKFNHNYTLLIVKSAKLNLRSKLEDENELIRVAIIF